MIKVVIFDMDGLIIDSEPIWEQAENNIVQKYHKKINPKIRIKYLGRGLTGMVEILKQGYGLPISSRTARQSIKEYMKKNITKPPVKLLPGSKKLIKKFKIDQVFNVIISGEEVKRIKPNPDIFLKCAELLKLSPEECLVLEDSPNGIAAAKRAGMKSIAIYNKKTQQPEDFFVAPNKIFSSLEYVSLETIKELE